MPTPFATPNDLSTVYGPPDGGSLSSFRTTVPENFAKCKSEILGLHARLGVVEQVTGAAAGPHMRAGVNEFFSVHRFGPSLFAQLTSGPATRFFYRQGAFISPYTSGQGDGFVAPGPAGHYSYIQSAFPGWFCPLSVLSNLGTPVNSGESHGARFRFDGTATYYNSMQPGVGAGYAVAGSGDLPGVYQVLTRHVPVEALRGRALSVRLRYQHSAAIPATISYKMFISYYDGAKRYDSLSATALTVTTAMTELVHSTAADPVMFPNGVLPNNVTAVEVGVVMATRTGSFVTDDLDVYAITTDIGPARADYSIPPYADEFSRAAMFYAQPLGCDRTGRNYGTQNHPLVDGGATPAPAGTTVLSEAYPWALALPWRKAVNTLVPNCRVVEVIGAVADGTGAGYDLTATDSVSVNVANRAPEYAGTPLPARGMTLFLDRTVTVTPPALSQMLSTIDLPLLQWYGEVQCAIGPIGY